MKSLQKIGDLEQAKIKFLGKRVKYGKFSQRKGKVKKVRQLKNEMIVAELDKDNISVNVEILKKY